MIENIEVCVTSTTTGSSNQSMTEIPTDCETQCERSSAGMHAVKVGALWGRVLVWQVSQVEG